MLKVYGREIESNAVDYHDGHVMVQFTDTGEIEIVEKEAIKYED